MSLTASIQQRHNTKHSLAAGWTRAAGRDEIRERSAFRDSAGGDLHRESRHWAAKPSDTASDEILISSQNKLPVPQDCSCSIIAAVKNRWALGGYTELKTINCAYVEGVLTISGSVSSYYHKQMAQESVRGVDGIHQIVNELTVTE